MLFGDGAGAAVVESVADERGARMHPFHCQLGSDGSLAELVWIPAGQSKILSTDPEFSPQDTKIIMRGNDLFKEAVRNMKKSVVQCLETTGLSVDDIALLVPHQANIRIIDRVCEELKFPRDKVMINIDSVGNTSSASIPIACSMAIEEGRLKSGDLVLATAFGGGLTYGACVFPLSLGRVS